VKRKIDRYNIITILVYVLGSVLLLQLFNLQILNGQKYRDQSNTRLTRETTLEAARGSILDRTGQELTGTKMGFSLELYKTKADDNTLNNTLLNTIKVLEQNGDGYIDTLPIKADPFAFTLDTDDKIKSFESKNKISAGATAEEAFNQLKSKYNIQDDNVDEALKIMGLRYEIANTGYSSTKSIILSKDISRQSVLEFNEQSYMFPGVNVVVEPLRDYKEGTLASHIIGYIGKINDTELANLKDKRL